MKSNYNFCQSSLSYFWRVVSNSNASDSHDIAQTYNYINTVSRILDNHKFLTEFIISLRLCRSTVCFFKVSSTPVPPLPIR